MKKQSKEEAKKLKRSAWLRMAAATFGLFDKPKPLHKSSDRSYRSFETIKQLQIAAEDKRAKRAAKAVNNYRKCLRNNLTLNNAQRAGESI